MPRDLFGDVTRPSISVGNRKWYTVPVSLFTHSLAVGSVIALPLLAPAVMPSVFADSSVDYVDVWLPPPPPPPVIRPAIPTDPPPAKDAIPVAAPDGITAEKPQAEPRWEDSIGSSTIIGDVDPEVISPPLASPPIPQAPVQIGGLIRRPQKVHDVQPVYPPMAQAARVQGIVIIEATLSADGRVMNARVLRSVPLLDNAALDAVRQWEFTPTSLNGVPVPVVMTVTVQFVLSK